MWEDFRKQFGNDTRQLHRVRERVSMMQLQWGLCWSPMESWSREARGPMFAPHTKQPVDAGSTPGAFVTVGKAGLWRDMPGERLSCEQPVSRSWNECVGPQEGIWGMQHGIHYSLIKIMGQ